MDALEAMEGTTLATRSVTLCLDSDLKGQWDKAAAGLEEAARLDHSRGSMAMEHTVAKVEEMDGLRDRMAASEVTFEFQALDWQKRLALQAEHPPREDNVMDQARGYDISTFCPELIKKSCTAVTGADGKRVTKIPVKSWTRMFARLNLGQFNDLFQHAGAVDKSPVVPTSARFLLMSRDSEASSTPPGPGTSPRSGSAAGSRRTSRRTRTTKKAASPA